MATATLSDVLPSAADCRQKSALKEAEKASEYARRQAAAAEEKKALFERLEKPSGVSDEERLRRAAAIIKRAVDNGLTEVQVGRFPNKLCTDRGRAINQQEPGWEDTLHRPPQGAIRVLEGAPAAARLSREVPDRRLAGWDAWRHRHHVELGRGTRDLSGYGSMAASRQLASRCGANGLVK